VKHHERLEDSRKAWTAGFADRDNEKRLERSRSAHGAVRSGDERTGQRTSAGGLVTEIAEEQPGCFMSPKFTNSASAIWKESDSVARFNGDAR